MYVFLLAALALALWLSSAGGNRLRWRVAMLVPVFLFPSYSPAYVHGTEQIPRFFSSGVYRHYLSLGENVLLIPPQNRTDFIFPDSMVIQARTGFSFRMLVGYAGPFPPEYGRSAILQAVYRGELTGIDPEAVHRLLLDHQVGHVVVSEGSSLESGWTAIMGPPVRVMDVLVYPVSR